MEYVENGDLAMYLAEKGESARQDASEISIQLLESLEFLHKMGVCHHDLKPQVRLLNLIILLILIS
jgi:serine/threonine protein kinase